MKNRTKHIIVLVLIQIGVVINKPTFAQLTLTNPSFEDKISWFNKIPGWDSCSNFVYVASVGTPYFFGPPQKNGNNFGIIEQGGTGFPKFSFITNKTSCVLLKNTQCKLSLWAMGYFPHLSKDYELGYFTIHLGYTACDSSQLIYQSPIMYDTLQWYKYEFEFIPNDNYQYIGIQAHHKSIDSVIAINIDNFSPISVEIPFTAHIQVNNVQGNCYGLQFNLANSVQATRHEWRLGSVVISNQSTINEVCINEPSTVYLTAWDACGYAYTDSFNFDTSALQYQYNEANSNLAISLVPFDKPIQLQLYNALGQLVSFTSLSAQTTSYNLSVNNLTNGIYFITLVTDKYIVKQKFWKY